MRLLPITTWKVLELAAPGMLDTHPPETTMGIALATSLPFPPVATREPLGGVIELGSTIGYVSGGEMKRVNSSPVSGKVKLRLPSI